MTKSVEELIYDYLQNGKEATIANKMRCFNTVQDMFTQIAKTRYVEIMRNKSGPSGLRVIGPMDWLKQKQAELERECNPLTKLSPFDLESGGNISQMMSRRRALKERDIYQYFFRGDVNVREGVLLEALYPRLEDSASFSIRLSPDDIEECMSSKFGMFRRQNRLQIKMKPEFSFHNKLRETIESGEPMGEKFYPNVLMSPMSIMRRLNDCYVELYEQNFRKEMLDGASKAQLEHNRRILHAGIYSQMLQALRETRYEKALDAYCDDVQRSGRSLDLPRFDVNLSEVGTRIMLGNMRSMHEVQSLDYPRPYPTLLSGIAGDFDGEHYPTLENKMKYIVKLLTTEIFHNEVVLVNSLMNRLNNDSALLFGNGYRSLFEEVLASMAALGQPSITLEDHELVTQLIDRNLPGASGRLTLTAPTEDNPAVIAAFYVAAERDLPSMPVFAVAITPATEENKDDMKELENIIDSYHEVSRDIVAGYLAGHLPVRHSQILKNLTIEAYDPKADARNSIRGLNLSEVMLTAGQHVEWLLGNSVKLQEYIAALEESGVVVAVDKIPLRHAFWSKGDRGQAGWMIVPVETEFGSDQIQVTVYASEDDLINYHAPRRYREAEVVVNREKAMRFADNFFDAE